MPTSFVPGGSALRAGRFLRALLRGGMVLGLALAGLAGPAEPVPAQAPVRVGINRNFPPYEYLDALGQPAGYDVDIIKAAAAEVNLPLVFQAGPWAAVRADLEAGRLDVVPGMLFSEERARLVDFSAPHLVIHYAIFVRRGSPEYRSLEDLRGHTVVSEQGSRMHDHLVKLGLADHLVLAPSEPDALAMLAAGRVEAALVPRILGVGLVRARKLDNVIPLGESVFAQDLCFATAKGREPLLASLGTGLALLNRTGQYRVIYDRWFGHADPEAGLPRRYLRIAAWGALGVVVAGLLLAGWFWSLKKQVQQRTEALERATRSMAANEQFLASIIEAMPMAIFGKDPARDFRYNLWNAKAEEIWGIGREEILGRTDQEVFDPDQAAAFQELDRQVLARPGPVEAPEEVVATRTQGTLFLHTVKTAIRDAEGRPRLVLGISRNVTEQKRLETELKKSRASLAKAQSLALIGNWLWEIGTNELSWSDQMFRILGIAPGAVVPGFHAVLERTYPEDRGILRKSLRRFHHGKERPPVEFRVAHPDGSIRWVQSNIEVEREEDGRAVRLVGTFQDITERRLTEEAFRQAQKLESMGVLAGGIAHDFNNLLSAIGGNLELAQLNLGPQPAAGEFLVRIEKILRRASQLTHQMLAYSGKGHFVVKPLNLNAVAEEMPHLLEVSISKRVRLEYRFEPGLPLIDADVAQIQQVIMNLVTNASEAIGDRDGTITLTTGAEYLQAPNERLESRGWTLMPGLFATLEVTDTGCGMDADTRRRLFDPFFTTKFSGRGLGLSAMLGILRGHHAGIHIHSVLGQGSSFKLFFPASSTAPAEAPKAVRSAPAPATGTILVVDDEPDILEATAELLTTLGFQTTLAQDGQEAVARYTANPKAFDLVLMDLTMPRMDGKEALRALRTLDPHVKIVLCSGFNEADVTKEFPYSSLSGFLQKPYTFQALKDVVHQALA